MVIFDFAVPTSSVSGSAKLWIMINYNAPRYSWQLAESHPMVDRVYAEHRIEENCSREYGKP